MEDRARDLGRVELWEASLQRSLERRGKTRPSSVELHRPRPARALKGDVRGRSAPYSGQRRRPAARPTMPRPAVTITGVSVLALMVAAAAPSLVGAKGHRQRAALVADAGPSGGAGIAVPTSAATKSAVATGIGGYVNPLMVAQVVPERIDQGVDYAGTGVLVALGAGRVTYSAASDTAWPGAFVEYRLTSGVYAGRYVYYAEGITPQVHVGEKLRAGQAVAKLIPRYSYGIEIGWGAGIGTETYAMQHGQWNSSDDADNVPSTAGRNFSRLIAELGGPPGKVEG